MDVTPLDVLVLPDTGLDEMELRLAQLSKLVSLLVVCSAFNALESSLTFSHRSLVQLNPSPSSPSSPPSTSHQQESSTRPRTDSSEGAPPRGSGWVLLSEEEWGAGRPMGISVGE